MSGRHRARTTRSNLVIGSIAASVGVSSVLAAAIVELVSPDAPSAASTAPSAQQQPLTQQGRVTAVTANTITTQGVDGQVHTYTITPNTTAITQSGQSASPAGAFAVNDQVTVVGTRDGSSAVATAVADQAAVGPQGRPMDYGL